MITCKNLVLEKVFFEKKKWNKKVCDDRKDACNSRSGVWICFLWMLVLSSCQKNQEVPFRSPQGTLNAYLKKSFSVYKEEDRLALERFLTGKAQLFLAGWSRKKFQKVFLNKKRTLYRIRLLRKEIQKKKASITYVLSYGEKENGKSIHIESKKVAFFSKKENKWLIEEVRNLKTLLEYGAQMSLP